ncbi:hypothetical protein QO010_001308 [Caulobacter ginsengisoli]|uniref:Aspartyl/asparaginy/proline hydroxylase domain-containing protein n=1 Tax=Caulobacter ginsengisoli TaxID=400775 RepID=A0ABU0ING6_9CAUL|nr:aspartyl/asparaginyl beta-hydroxylase domain-containing protein [Caulobacter ginsengisoli]MDQ0463537.1 hypothetical protein [Caulobacter ginsengisoli]
MLDAFNLPVSFDVAALQADLAKVGPEEWLPHVNRAHYEGDWTVLALRSIDGHVRRTAPMPGGDYRDTVHMARFPYFREVLTAFPMALESVRLLRLAAGSAILEHSDGNLGFADGQVRFHVPIVTSPLVDFRLRGQRLDMREGEAWYADFNLPHSVDNRSQIVRVHLVIDGPVNDWVRGVFEEAEMAWRADAG